MNNIEKLVTQACANTKRGDTVIEVMFAFAVFSFVAVLSIIIMNNGVTNSEASLEVVTSRNELNAQAEAIRFVHDSYIDEATLPTCSGVSSEYEDCQQYKDLWQQITSQAISLSDLRIKTPLTNCNEAYSGNALQYAFVLNPRNIAARNASDSSIVKYSSGKFSPATLNARIIYGPSSTGANDDDGIANVNQRDYNVIQKVEGLWVIAVKGEADVSGRPSYYDFYIQSCWNPPTGGSPTSIDTVIRLYNPEGV